jgi:hypothetical protein
MWFLFWSQIWVLLHGFIFSDPFRSVADFARFLFSWQFSLRSRSREQLAPKMSFLFCARRCRSYFSQFPFSPRAKAWPCSQGAVSPGQNWSRRCFLLGLKSAGFVIFWGGMSLVSSPAKQFRSCSQNFVLPSCVFYVSKVPAARPCFCAKGFFVSRLSSQKLARLLSFSCAPVDSQQCLKTCWRLKNRFPPILSVFGKISWIQWKSVEIHLIQNLNSEIPNRPILSINRWMNSEFGWTRLNEFKQIWRKLNFTNSNG